MKQLSILSFVLLVAASVAGCSLISSDPSHRSPGVIIDDNVQEARVERLIRQSDGGFKGAHLVVVSHNGLVLLTGQVASADLKEKAANVASGAKNVRRVHNELTVGGPISIVARTNDAWLTSKVKSRLLANKNVDGIKIKVQTENSVVFLMGMVTRAQADAAVQVASNVYGVQKIVKVFEYLDVPVALQAVTRPRQAEPA